MDVRLIRKFRLLSASKWFSSVPPRKAANLNTVTIGCKARRPQGTC